MLAVFPLSAVPSGPSRGADFLLSDGGGVGLASNTTQGSASYSMLGQSCTNAQDFGSGEGLGLASLEWGLWAPLDRANRRMAKAGQPEKVLPQAARSAVIYSHLYRATSKADGQREAAECRSNLSVAEIKGNTACCHAPLRASAPTDILAQRGSPGGKLSPVAGAQEAPCRVPEL